jgi:hypothetical protein
MRNGPVRVEVPVDIHSLPRGAGHPIVYEEHPTLVVDGTMMVSGPVVVGAAHAADRQDIDLSSHLIHRHLRSARHPERAPHLRLILAVDHHSVVRPCPAEIRTERIILVSTATRIYKERQASQVELNPKSTGVRVGWLMRGRGSAKIYQKTVAHTRFDGNDEAGGCENANPLCLPWGGPHEIGGKVQHLVEIDSVVVRRVIQHEEGRIGAPQPRYHLGHSSNSLTNRRWYCLSYRIEDC